MDRIEVSVQYFIGCPHADAMLMNVREAVAPLAGSVDYSETLVDSDEKAVELKFRGSPTLIINGIDFEGMPEPAVSALTCRYYRNGLPSPDQIRQKIVDVMSDAREMAM